MYTIYISVGNPNWHIKLCLGFLKIAFIAYNYYLTVEWCFRFTKGWSWTWTRETKVRYSKCFLNCELLTASTLHFIWIFHVSRNSHSPFCWLWICVSQQHVLRLFYGSLKFFEHKLCNVFSFGRILIAFQVFSMTEVPVTLNYSISMNKVNIRGFTKYLEKFVMHKFNLNLIIICLLPCTYCGVWKPKIKKV